MENGIIRVRKTKKGFAGHIEYEKDSKTKQLILSVISFQDDNLNGKTCTFERDKGTLIKLVVENEVIYSAFSQSSSSSSHQQAQNTGDSKRGATHGGYLNFDNVFAPKDTLETAKILEQTDLENFSLKLNKAARYEFDGQRYDYKFSFVKKDRKGNGYEIKETFSHLSPSFFEEKIEAQKKAAKAICSETNDSVHELDWRMILGLGNESVYETSITLHHIYGIPYIPASSIKGVVRSWIITEYFSTHDAEGTTRDFDLKDAEKRAMKNPDFTKIFGDTSQQGQIIFFDAFPTSAPTIEVDIMNPHYGPYYSDNKNVVPPADYHMPVPVSFLTVAGCAFQFIIGSKKQALEEYPIADKTISDWLKDALTQHGIGAKTAVGYGYMS